MLVRRARFERASPGWKPGALPLSERLWCRRQGTILNLPRFRQARRPTTPQRQLIIVICVHLYLSAAEKSAIHRYRWVRIGSREQPGPASPYTTSRGGPARTRTAIGRVQTGCTPVVLQAHLVREAGFEPARIAPQRSRRCVSAIISPPAHWCGSQDLNLHGPFEPLTSEVSASAISPDPHKWRPGRDLNPRSPVRQTGMLTTTPPGRKTIRRL